MRYFFELFNKYLFGIGVPFLLIGLGLYFCLKLRFFYLLRPLKILGALKSPKGEGKVSSAKALSLALAGTLGVGNMVGVASAIVLGGFGAVFWMWVSAFVAMVLKYAEILLAIRHRRYENGKLTGNAMLYIKDAFGKNLGKLLAFVFACLCILNALSMGSMIQVRAVAEASEGVFGVPPIAVGILIAIVALIALCRGSSGVLSLTEKLVPLMTMGFVVLSFAVIFSRLQDTVLAFKLIFSSAFKYEAIGGGVLGFFLSGGLRYGTMRGILSNEAGCGTSPSAHATADCNEPARQGVWGIFEVFADTILLCTLTAVVIIISFDNLTLDGNYMMMTVSAYTAVLGEWSGYFLTAAVVCFGLATVVCWGYYGSESMRYISNSPLSHGVFIVVYCTSALLGSILKGSLSWELADFAIGGMCVINLSALFALRGEIKDETERYFKIK